MSTNCNFLSAYVEGEVLADGSVGTTEYSAELETPQVGSTEERA